MTRTALLKRQAEARLPTEWGPFRIYVYASESDDPMPHIALVHQDFDASRPAYVRIHSECMTGDIFHSDKCDCGKQLYAAMDALAEEKGILIYLRQEGRGIGLINKIKAYALQESGMDTIQANLHLGLQADDRRYDDAVDILRDLEVNRLWLLTNNPDKIQALEKADINILGRIPLLIEPTLDSALYLKVKQTQMGHLLNLHQ